MSFAFAQDAEKINSALEEATRLYNAGDYKRAAGKFEEALRLDPNRPSTHYNAAVCYETLGNKMMAARHLREYLELDPRAGDRKEVRGWIDALEARPTAQPAGKPGAKDAKPAAAPAAAPLVTPPKTWVAKAGIFMCGNKCEPDYIDINIGWTVGAEYWTPFKRQNVIQYGLFYARSDYDFTHPVSGAQSSGEMEYGQVSASYLWIAPEGEVSKDEFPAGMYYGLGLGYGVVNFDGAVNDSDKTLDVNGIIGYNFDNSITAELIWLIDESAGTLSVGYRPRF